MQNLLQVSERALLNLQTCVPCHVNEAWQDPTVQSLYLMQLVHGSMQAFLLRWLIWQPLEIGIVCDSPPILIRQLAQQQLRQQHS